MFACSVHLITKTVRAVPAPLEFKPQACACFCFSALGPLYGGEFLFDMLGLHATLAS